ncbi:hypothetical protein, variant [Puccinia triticina 1-1 BBBD Race 1]|uniref:Uncharacterized protein n=1 Tax=Puccinia triticina (isolate 1-1 / race 1 (BBBD)) TaxID=630390 RepID=A0A180GPX9_PUCT1|nr:hypothetical protein, variant [Puccinia triticina 1-1 BBBD Race 1]
MPQEDPVLVGFDRLIKKHEPLYSEPWTFGINSLDGAFSALSLDQVRAHKKLLDWMHRSLLPRLNEQIRTLAILLLPSDYWKNPKETRKLILQVQSELDNTTDAIKSIITSICPTSTGLAQERTDDQHLKGLKSFRLQLLKPRIHNDLLYHINKVFSLAHELFQQIKLAPDAVKPDKFDGCSYRNDFIKDAWITFRGIDLTIKFMESSELDLAQEQWVFQFAQLDKTIRGIVRTANQLQSKQINNPKNLQVRKAAELARIAIPMTKLIKMFFIKISKEGINQRRFPTYTKMSSQQIQSLTHSLDTSGEDLLALQSLLSRIGGSGFGAANSREAMQIANNLKSRAETTLSLVLLYCVPLIKNTDGFESREYYKTWFDTWSAAFDLATPEAR